MAGIFETRWICEPIPSDRLHCPHCQQPRDVRRVILHPWLAVLGHELARIGRPREFSACQGCGRVYRVYSADDTVDRDPMSEDERALFAVIAAVIFSDSRVRRTEKHVAREVIRRYTGAIIEPADMDALLRSARTRWGDPIGRLRRLACVLDDAVKLRIIEAAYLVSTADRELHTQESHLLNRIGEALDIPPRDIRRAIQDATLAS